MTDSISTAIIARVGAHKSMLEAGAVHQSEARRETPFGPSNPIHLMELAGTPFAILSRHGEKGYEVAAPWVNDRANLYALKELGVEKIASFSSPGSLDPKVGAGDLLIPDDVLDERRGGVDTFFEGKGIGVIRQATPFCPGMADAFAAALSSEGFATHVGHSAEDARTTHVGHSAENANTTHVDHSAKGAPTTHLGGVYVGTQGPRLETPAEIRKYRSFGGTVVGMTVVPEVFLARELEMCYAGVCLVVNQAEGLNPAPYEENVLFEGLARPEELDRVRAVEGELPRILPALLRAAAGFDRACHCGKAMERYKTRGDISKDWKNWWK